MAGAGYTTFQLVHGTASGTSPTTADLTVAGELAVNPEDGFLWTRNQAGEIVALINSSNRANNNSTTTPGTGNHTHDTNDIIGLNELFANGGRPQVRTETGTTYTIDKEDEFTKIRFTSGSAISVTVPADTDDEGQYDFPIGYMVHLEQAGSGQITVAGAGGVTVGSSRSLITAGQYSVFALMYNGSDQWTLVGDQE